MKSARVYALHALAQRRLTESALWNRLERKAYPEDEIRSAIERCRADGLLDDRLFAQLYIASKRKALGNARLTAELTAKGIDRDIAATAVRENETDEPTRCERAADKIFRIKSDTSYPSAARRLERLGFPAKLIYQILRDRAAKHGPLADFREN